MGGVFARVTSSSLCIIYLRHYAHYITTCALLVTARNLIVWFLDPVPEAG